ncbi:MAG TPA: hypothetical protein VGT44_05350 [Ktedonobacteraceae bacterium]|nr:hypothetical protein [Ktedonobacteraceae bacterium]
MLLICLAYQGWFAPAPAHAQAAQGDAYIVTILGNTQPPGYSPALLTVHVYDTVVFVNRSVPAASYAVIANDGSFSSPSIQPGQQWSVTFSSPGAFEYQESASSPRMTGVIVVAPASVPLLPAPLPAAQATAIAYVQAGKMPPDNISQQAVAPAQQTSPGQQGKSIISPFASPGLFALFFAGAAVCIVALELLGFGIMKWSKPTYQKIKTRIREMRLSWKDDDDE